MKVLIVSHTVISETNNMGKTLLSYFGSFSPDELAQLYVKSYRPMNDSICHKYYRFTDRDALSSLLPFSKRGQKFEHEDIGKEEFGEDSEGNIISSINQKGHKKNPSSMIARELVWKFARWHTKELKKWLMNFDPDVIFFMSGDYAFLYNIALYISRLTGKPLVICCVDDYYVYNCNQHSFLGRMHHKQYMKTVVKTMKNVDCIFTISDMMRDKYHEMFQKPCFTLHTSAPDKELELNVHADRISYLGNLHKRHEQIISIGRAIKDLNRDEEPKMLDVYSATTDKEIVELMNEENGIRFHGRVSPKEVENVMKDSMLVVHTESFDQETRMVVQYSVSTKIPESLKYGPCLLAYGPEEVASIDYLKKNDVAYVITEEKELKRGLQAIIEDEQKRKNIVKRARVLANDNHNALTNSKWLHEKLREISMK